MQCFTVEMLSTAAQLNEKSPLKWLAIGEWPRSLRVTAISQMLLTDRAYITVPISGRVGAKNCGILYKYKVMWAVNLCSNKNPWFLTEDAG